jgi:hypothetical protein
MSIHRSSLRSDWRARARLRDEAGRSGDGSSGHEQQDMGGSRTAEPHEVG